MKIITVPFNWLLMTLYDFVGNYGLAIILFALIVKLILLPFQMKSKRSMMRTSSLAPKLKELEKKFGDNKQKYQEEVAKIYKEEGIKPMSGCLWSLIPFPILIALYSVIRQPLTHAMGLAAEQIAAVQDKLVALGVYTIPEKVDAYYEKSADRSVRFDDPAFGIAWDLSDPVLSEKDKNAPLFADSDVSFVYGREI